MPNLGNLVELFIFCSLVGTGAVVGNALGGLAGSVVGALAGVLVRLGFGLLISRMPFPACQCGADPLDAFDVTERATWEYEYACRRCGRRYELRRRSWSECLDDGTVVPRLRRRGVLGVWRIV
jgi:hypothetical protein